MKNGDDLLTRHLNANSTARHQELIASVRELVKDIHKSELYSRSLKADAYRSQPYFATDVEMTARAFEGHIQHTLSKMGIKNDFLVNIKAEKDWQKNLDAYPYPKAEELEPLGKAYNAVFDTLKEVDKEFIPTHYEPEQIIHADTLAVTEAEKTKENQPFALDAQNQDNTYSNSIDNAIQGKPLESAKIWVGRTPQVLQMLGVQDLPVYIHRKTVLKDAIRKHNITADDIKAIPSQLERPIAVMKSAQTSSNPNAYLVLTELIEKENGKDKPVIAVLSVAQKEDSIEINSVYGRRQSQIERDLNNVLYWDSKKGQQFIDSFGYQLPPSLSNADLLHHYKTEKDLSQYILKANLDKDYHAKIIEDNVKKILQDYTKDIIRFNSSIDKVIGGSYGRGYVPMGRTPDVLKILGVPDTKVRIKEQHLEKVMAIHLGIPDGKYETPHNVTPDTLRKIPSEIHNPIAVFKSSTRDNSYLTLTEQHEQKATTGENSPIAVIFNVNAGKDEIDIINIGSIYGRSQNQLVKDFTENLLYINTEKGQKFLNTERLQLPWDFTSDTSNLSQDYKTEKDLSQYILQANLDKERIEQFLQIATEIQAKIDNAPNKELSAFAQVIYEDIQSVHDKAQKETAPTFDELEIAKRHLEGLNYSFEKK
ncbi:LPD1 domain-containing protein [Moraxella nasicaprae]|uniref:Phage MuF C-terminal domain-containing protein n=1 Tax=Moraxella nasicaprae TaxID=2904122 RepID=A0ABY6F4S7_9GAMM|nr:LPD1 domain-containing protein [Moraxella nasicaprae]UXZ05106.1 hypothetical protein LU297_01225 [Moraxella nasicaprae]